VHHANVRHAHLAVDADDVDCPWAGPIPGVYMLHAGRERAYAQGVRAGERGGPLRRCRLRLRACAGRGRGGALRGCESGDEHCRGPYHISARVAQNRSFCDDDSLATRERRPDHARSGAGLQAAAGDGNAAARADLLIGDRVKRILVTGAGGQVGTELVPALRAAYGDDAVMATDIRQLPDEMGLSEQLDVTDAHATAALVKRHRADAIYHLAALLSATAEAKPQMAYDINMGTLMNVLEVARETSCAVFTPSSIGAFGPTTPRNPTPQDTIQRPTTMYGVTKVAGELLCDYYNQRYGMDTRGLRYPGLISYVAPPGGGTTDYAVDIFYKAIEQGSFTCFLQADTQLDMMYMPDAIRASIEVMEADVAKLQHRNAFNVTAMQLTPETLAAEIRRHIPGFTIDYDVDTMRQNIANSWPQRLDDSAARAEWGWAPRYDMAAMTEEMLTKLREKLGKARS
jgi:nucleoside-diphosphate-sugar epimerase